MSAKWVYNDRRWDPLRKATWLKANGLCAKCGKQVKTEGSRFDPYYYECNHIKPIDTHPDLAFDPDNLECLHRQCHRAETSKQQSNRMQRNDGW